MLVSDKREEVKRLEESGMERPLSESTVEMTISVVDKHAATKADLESLATKTDVAETNERMTAGFDKLNESISKTNESISKTNERVSETKAKIDAARAEFYKSISETNKSMAAGFAELNERISETNSKIDAVKTEIINRMFRTMLAMAGLGVGVAGLVVAAVTLLLRFAGG